MTPPASPPPSGPDRPWRRRPRYAGTHPRRFADKYKERDPARHPETIAKVIASGKTPAGSHRPVMVAEVLAALELRPGDRAADCTLGHGGHACEILRRILPGGRLLGLDADPLELPRAESRLLEEGAGPGALIVRRTNFAALPSVLAELGWPNASAIFADLGVSSMQLDNPERGFSFKSAGPLDMRMNPRRGEPASALLARLSPEALAAILREHADEPHAERLAPRLAGRPFATTTALAGAISAAVPAADGEASVRRVFQALRIAVNDELNVLETLLRALPACLAPGGRAAILTFHSGEDRRVKKAFEAGLREGAYSALSPEPIRPTPSECAANPRAAPAKLRWARRPA